MIKLRLIKSNEYNPRVIRDEKFAQLVASLSAFPAMMELRPIIIDENNVILGGNMRYHALKDLGYKEIPDEWVHAALNLTEAQKLEFIIKDNVSFGEWNWDSLANDFEIKSLIEWGLDLPFNTDPEISDEMDPLDKTKSKKEISFKLIFESTSQLSFFTEWTKKVIDDGLTPAQAILTLIQNQ